MKSDNSFVSVVDSANNGTIMEDNSDHRHHQHLEQQLYVDPFEESSSSSSSSSSSPSSLPLGPGSDPNVTYIDMDKFRMLLALMGEDFIVSMCREDFIQFYESVSENRWVGLAMYYQLSLAIDAVSDVRLEALSRLDDSVNGENTENLS